MQLKGKYLCKYQNLYAEIRMKKIFVGPAAWRTKLQSHFLLLMETLDLRREPNSLSMSDWFILHALVFLLVPSSTFKAANDLLDLQPAFQQPLPLSTTNTWGGESSSLLANSSVHTATTFTNTHTHHILISTHTSLRHSPQYTHSVVWFLRIYAPL